MRTAPSTTHGQFLHVSLLELEMGNQVLHRDLKTQNIFLMSNGAGLSFRAVSCLKNRVHPAPIRSSIRGLKNGTPNLIECGCFKNCCSQSENLDSEKG